MNKRCELWMLTALWAMLMPPAAWSQLPGLTSSAPGPLNQQFAAARAQYFKGLQGDRAAERQARESFSRLTREHPGDALIEAYSGSLELLDAAHTWAIWDKRELATEGMVKLDSAVNQDPANLEVRFIRAASTWHLPFFFHRRAQAESDFAYIVPRAEPAAKQGILPAPLAAAALDYNGPGTY